MEWQFSKCSELFYFQVKESPATLNIPTPTPAPDNPLRGPSVFVAEDAIDS